jgi:hypothetical protein
MTRTIRLLLVVALAGAALAPVGCGGDSDMTPNPAFGPPPPIPPGRSANPNGEAAKPKAVKRNK